MTDKIEIPFKVSVEGNAQAIFGQIKKGFNDIAKGLQEAAKAQLKLQNADVANSLGHTAMAIQKVTAALGKEAPTKKWSEDLEKLSLRFQDVLKASNVFGDKAKTIFKSVGEGSMSIEKAKEKLTELQKQFQQFKTVGADVEVVQKRFERLTAGVEVGTSEFADAVNKTKSFGLAIADLANKMKIAGVYDEQWINSLREGQIALAQEYGHIKQVGKEFKILDESGYSYLKMTKAQREAIRSINTEFVGLDKALAKAEKRYGTNYSGLKAYTDALNKLAGVYGQSRTAVDAYVARLDKTDKALANFKLSARTLPPDLQKIVNSVDRAELVMASLDGQLKITADGFKALSVQGLKPFGNVTVAQAQKMNILDKSFDRMIAQEEKYMLASGKTAEKVRETTDAFLKEGKSFDEVSKKYQVMTANMRSAGDSASTFADAFSKLGRSFKTYARYMISSAVLRGFTEQLHNGINSIIEYDQSLKDLQAIMNATAAETLMMGEAITAVAKDTKFSMGEVGDAMRKLGQAGFSAQEATASIPSIANLATGTLETLETTVNLVSTAIRVFGMEMTDAAQVSDIFANAVNRSRLTIDKLNTSFNYIGPLAAAAGLSLQDTAAGMMLLANQGVRASTIGTGMRRVLGGLLKPTEKFKNAVYLAGYTMADFNPELVGFEEIVGRLPKVVDDARDAIEMFGYRGSSVISAFARGGSEEFARLKMALSEQNAALRMAQKQMEGLKVAIKNFNDRIGVLGKTLGESGLTGVLKAVVDIGRSFIDFLIQVAGNPVGQLLIGVTAVGAAVTTLGLSLTALIEIGVVGKVMLWVQTFGNFTTVLFGAEAAAAGATVTFGTMAASIQAATTAMISFMLTPFGLALTTIVGLVAVAALAWKDHKDAQKDAAITNEEFSGSLKSTLDQFDKYHKVVDKHGEKSKEANKQGLVLRASVKSLGDTWQEVKGDADEFTDSIDENTGALKGNKDAVKGTEEALRKKYVRTLINVYRQDSKNIPLMKSKIAYQFEVNKQTKETERRIKDLQKALGEEPSGFMNFFKKWTVTLGVFGNSIGKIKLAYQDLKQDAESGMASAVDELHSLQTASDEIIKKMEKDGLTHQKVIEMTEEDIKSLMETYGVFVWDSQRGYYNLLESLKKYGTEKAKMTAQAKKDQDALDGLREHFKALGIAIGGKEMSEAFKLLMVHFDAVLKSGKATSQDLITAFTALGDEVENVADFNKLMEALGDLKRATKLTGIEMSRLKTIVNGAAEEVAKDAEAIFEVANRQQKFIDLKAADDELTLLRAKLKKHGKLSEAEQKKFDLAMLKIQVESAGRTLLAEKKKWKDLNDAQDAGRIVSAEQMEEAYASLQAASIAHKKALDELWSTQEEDKQDTRLSALKKRLNAIEYLYTQNEVKLKERAVRGFNVELEMYNNTVAFNNAKKKAYEDYYASLTSAEQTHKDEILKKINETNIAALEATISYQEKTTAHVLKEQNKRLAQEKAALKTSMDAAKQEYEAGKISATELKETRIDLLEQYKDKVIQIYAIIQALYDKDSDTAEQKAKDLQNLLDKIQAGIDKAEDNVEGQKEKEKAGKIADAAEKKDLKMGIVYETPESEMQRELDLLQKQMEEKLSILSKYDNVEEEMARTKDAYLRMISKKRAEWEEKVLQARIQRMSDFSGNMSSIAKDLYDSGVIQSKKAFNAYKAFAVAQTIISTYQSAQEAYKKMSETNVFLASVAAAKALAEGMARVAAIRSETPSFAEGGMVYGPGGPKEDKIEAKLSNREFVQPERTVDYYGVDVMEGLRKRLFPKELFASFKNLSSTTRFSNTLKSGGFAMANPTNSFSVNIPLTFNNTSDIDIGNKLGELIEHTVISFMRKELR